MIKVQLGDRRIGIGFEYRSRHVTLEEGKVLDSLQRVVKLPDAQFKAVVRDLTRTRLTATVVKIYLMAEGDLNKDAKMIFSHEEPCSREDNFCKETGRKFALTKLLEETASEYGRSSGFDKKEREMIWKAYLGRPRGPHTLTKAVA